MGMRNVPDIGEIEQVVVLSDLEPRLSLSAGFDHLRRDLRIAFTEYACRANRASEESI